MKQILLITLAVHGDRNALEQLVRQYYDAIYNYILQRVRQRETAEDLTQNVFVKLTASIAAYRPTASFSAFLYRIAHNTVVDFYRTSKAAEPLPESAAAPGCAERSDNKLLVQAMLDALNPQQRECILLYYFHGLTYGEIGKVLEIPTATAKSRVRRGLEACHKWMEDAK